ncbi:hypothetical protein NE317_04700 [Salmonella enterica subsp. houtenae serovar 16:z4,z32:--]|nr:hypothetical protein [Salmonella enterica]
MIIIKISFLIKCFLSKQWLDQFCRQAQRLSDYQVLITLRNICVAIVPAGAPAGTVIHYSSGDFLKPVSISTRLCLVSVGVKL